MIEKIISINILPDIQKGNFRQPIYNYGLKQDTVSFSGKNKKPVTPDLTPRVQTALGVQSKLNKLFRSNRMTYETIKEVLNKYSPIPIEVKPMSELPKELSFKNCIAYMQPFYDNDAELNKACIYLNIDTSNKRQATNIIADCIHEFTHVLQRFEDNDYLCLKEVSSELEEVRFLSYAACHSENDIETFVISKLKNNPGFKELLTKKSKTSSPVLKEDMEKFMPSKAELLTYTDNSINRHFDSLIKQLDLNEEAKQELLNFSEKSKPTVKKSIIRQFEMEFEAKTAEIEARKTGLLPDQETIFDSILMKTTYECILNAYKN